jgi:hypothetical protein
VDFAVVVWCVVSFPEPREPRGVGVYGDRGGWDVVMRIRFDSGELRDNVVPINTCNSVVVWLMLRCPGCCIPSVNGACLCSGVVVICTSFGGSRGGDELVPTRNFGIDIVVRRIPGLACRVVRSEVVIADGCVVVDVVDCGLVGDHGVDRARGGLVLTGVGRVDGGSDERAACTIVYGWRVLGKNTRVYGERFEMPDTVTGVVGFVDIDPNVCDTGVRVADGGG